MPGGKPGAAWGPHAVAHDVPAVHLEEGADELTIERVLATRVAIRGGGVVRSRRHARPRHGSRGIGVKDGPPELDEPYVGGAAIERPRPHGASRTFRAGV